MCFFVFVVVIPFCILILVLAATTWLRYHRHYKSVAFFHPQCDGLGGGERVLWCIAKAFLAEDVGSACGVKEVVIYSSSILTPTECLEKVQERFGIDLLPWLSTGDSANSKRPNLRFITLYTTRLIDPCIYPRFTLVLQSLGSVVVAFEALIRYVPHVFIDTTGFSFTLGLASLIGGCRTSSYIHYPTISVDMIRTVKNRRAQFNNSGEVANSRLLSNLKLIYYRLFAYCYGICGGFMDSCVVNSSWTYSHIVSLMTNNPSATETSPEVSQIFPKLSQIFPKEILSFLQRSSDQIKNMHCLPRSSLSVLYPPCDIKAFTASAKSQGSRVSRIISVSQFRPEKNHKLQLDALARLLQLYKSKSQPVPKDLELVICGAVRNSSDQKILDKLKEYCAELGLDGLVRFEVNLSFDQIKDLLGSSKIGLHTMIDEHFGIAVVEFLAAGLLVIAHNSAGPRMDILNISPSLLSTSSSSVGSEDKLPTANDQLPTSNDKQISDDDDVVMLDTPRRNRTAIDDENDCVMASFGFLCLTADGFAEALFRCLSGAEDRMLKRAALSLRRFNGNEEFGRKCLDAMNVKRLLED